MIPAESSRFRFIVRSAEEAVTVLREKLGPRVFGSDPHQPFLGRELGTEPSYSEEMAQEIDGEIFHLIDDAHQRAAKVLLEHEAALHEIAAILIEHETIGKEQFERLLHGEPAGDVLADDTPSKPARRAKARRAPTRKTRPRPAPVAKPLPSTSVAIVIDPDDPSPQTR